MGSASVALEPGGRRVPRQAQIRSAEFHCPADAGAVDLPDLHRIRGRLLHQLRENGFPGRILPINPSYQEIDGLACYRTEDSHFNQLNLHDNLAAGISLDLGFNNNTIDGAVLTGNDLGIFMRDSHDNVFERVTIRLSQHDGVFMAQTGEATRSGWRLWPGTECTGNKFNTLLVVECGGRAFQVNDSSCTNNIINDGQFLDNTQGGLSQPPANPVVARRLTVKPLRPILP